MVDRRAATALWTHGWPLASVRMDDSNLSRVGSGTSWIELKTLRGKAGGMGYHTLVSPITDYILPSFTPILPTSTLEKEELTKGKYSVSVLCVIGLFHIGRVFSSFIINI